MIFTLLLYFRRIQEYQLRPKLFAIRLILILTGAHGHNVLETIVSWTPPPPLRHLQYIATITH